MTEVPLHVDTTTAIKQAKAAIAELQEKIAPVQLEIQKLNSNLTSFLVGISIQSGYSPAKFKITLSEDFTKLLFEEVVVAEPENTDNPTPTKTPPKKQKK